jgi:hypothetical protein
VLARQEIGFNPDVSCFFGRIAPSDAATESRFSIRGNPENEIASFQASDPEILQSQLKKPPEKDSRSVA